MIKEEDLHPLQQLALQNFSYSRLSTYLSCNLKYYFSYIRKVPQVFGPAATLGNIIHQALEYTLEPNTKLDANELISNYYLSIPDFDPNAEIPEAMIESGLQMLQEYIDRHGQDEVPIHDKEHAFKIIIGNGRLIGFIDRIDVYESQKRVVIQDYKSGKVQVAKKDIPQDLQLGIYALVARDLFPDYEIYAELYYLKNGAHKGHTFTNAELDDVEVRVRDLISEILSKEYFEETPDESACWWCDYARNGTCPIGKYRLNKSRNRY